jgi:hypothetical protein
MTRGWSLVDAVGSNAVNAVATVCVEVNASISLKSKDRRMMIGERVDSPSLSIS